MSNKNNKNTVDLSLRQFIKDLGCVTGGAALLGTMPWLQSFTPAAAEEIKKEKARVALIGTGSRGLYHIHNLFLIPHAEIVALCDDYAPNLKAAAELVPKARTYTDYRKLLEAKDIDGVIISSPLNWHAPMVLDSLAAGKHVFCEKAMADSFQACKDIYDAYQETDKVLYFCMQRMFDEKYIKGMQMIHSGLIGEVVGCRMHWFRNHNWRRPVPSPELERKINWRLYWESSQGLMTELASHQLEVCNWATGLNPQSVMGMGDIVYWKDGREVYDSVSLVYRYSNHVKITYESLISNKFNGMEDEILGKEGTMHLASGVYYMEDEKIGKSGIEQLLNQIGNKVFTAIPAAGPSWRPETRKEYQAHNILKGKFDVNDGFSMIGVDNDGSDAILDAFCQACITGEKGKDIVEEAYSATTQCLLGNQAMAERREIFFPEEYKIPYMKF
ncbi:MAG: Inositol 2-dehydrogenase [Bacteroidetes bacterium ADurb.Bin174]|jgi:predicted dehydrogenase|nr:MAG: Inositol 2-dehydrogenase [Bacteroidetes bacterium ADurb.Bin174]